MSLLNQHVVKMVDWGSEGKRLRFYCEGCKQTHAIPVDGSRGWQWNGDYERPTITPSIKTTWTEHLTMTSHVCHIFVTDGIVDFLTDCTHDLAGQKRPLPILQKIGEDWE